MLVSFFILPVKAGTSQVIVSYATVVWVEYNTAREV